MNLTTPAVLFPAISLLLLAYTNRFLALASLIRALHDRHVAQPNELIVAQIARLRYRVRLILNMQTCGVASLLLCVLCMLALFLEWTLAAQLLFAASLLAMALSLAISLREIHLSVDALNLQLKDLESGEERQS